MSDSSDPEDESLLDLLRSSLGLTKKQDGSISPSTSVLRDAEGIASNAIDVAISCAGTVAAAKSLYASMREREYTTAAWSAHELHPDARDEGTVRFVFAMDLLNFSFWSERSEGSRYAVRYRGRRWTGYWGLVAALRRAEEEGVPVTDPSFWYSAEGKGDGKGEGRLDDEANGEGKVEGRSEGEGGEMQVDGEREEGEEQRNGLQREWPHLTREVMKHVFRGEGEEEMPLLDERLEVLWEAGRVLEEEFDGSVVNLIQAAGGSAGKLVNLLAHHFKCFRDESEFEGKRVRFLKRAQIFVADLWAAFDGTSYGAFDDIDCITMFADYRVPQQLHSLGCISYSPPLDYAVRSLKSIEPGSSWECQLRGCSIWTVELIRREILKEHPDAKVNAILIDFFLYDLAKERESAGEESIPHHRTRSIWY
ncbi:hypothetical protein K461DRAFT_278585 [Myriangium duriaei CBS 260.36]|uniref:Queuosine 5'-phosphate N-glycosylase/hydrolase n=1 Tax=Myriangium duriaei CBS 260.36 TaxID=1168546 RepID=A0A9P4MGN0_9PEZI|nr:hypothetical protein K461DRAFT_278585 [Myriangium duriaei CBS 260.36]